MIKEIFKGESCTLMFTFPEAYDMGRISSHKVYIGIQNYTGVIDGKSIVLKLKSSDTDKLCGVQKIVLWLDDSTLGLRKPYCGDLVITKTKAEADNESESDIYDIIIPIAISETSVTVGDILYNYVKGADGANGRGITSIILVSTVGLIKTYRITYTDSTTFEYSVSDGESPEITEQSIIDALGFTPDQKVKNTYTAFISQTGTNAPTEDVKLKDNLNTPVWSYSAVGTYLLTKADAFTVNKTIPNKAEVYIDNAGNKMTLERTSADVMTLKTYAAADTTVLANGVITGQYINIEVYL